MRRRLALLAFVFAALPSVAPAQTAPAPAGEERLTPRALPTPVAPKLTPLLPPDAKGVAVPRPAAAVLPPPAVAPPLSPVSVPGAAPPPPPLRPLPPAAEALPPAFPPAVPVTPPPPRKPTAAAPPPAFIEPAPPPAPATATAVRPLPDAPAAPPPADMAAKPPEAAPARDAGKEKAPEKGRNRTAWAKDDVYVRATPDRDGKVLDALLPGEKVEVLPGTVDRWSRVARNGKVLGYVASSYLLDKPPSARAAPSGTGGSDDDGCALPPDIPSGRRVALEEGSRARILADANLRDAPGCRGRVLDVLEEGDTVTVSAGQNGWYRVSRNGRTLGYVSGALLARTR